MTILTTKDIVHLVYHSELGTERHSKDYEFSKASYHKHLHQGYANTIAAVEKYAKKWQSSNNASGVDIYNA